MNQLGKHPFSGHGAIMGKYHHPCPISHRLQVVTEGSKNKQERGTLLTFWLLAPYGQALLPFLHIGLRNIHHGNNGKSLIDAAVSCVALAMSSLQA